MLHHPAIGVARHNKENFSHFSFFSLNICYNVQHTLKEKNAFTDCFCAGRCVFLHKTKLHTTQIPQHHGARVPVSPHSCNLSSSAEGSIDLQHIYVHMLQPMLWKYHSTLQLKSLQCHAAALPYSSALIHSPYTTNAFFQSIMHYTYIRLNFHTVSYKYSSFFNQRSQF